MARAYELGLPFAVLLPTDSIQRTKFGNLAKAHGVTVYVLNPAPKFFVDGEKNSKFVCATSWYLGNLPHHKQGLVEVIWTPTWEVIEEEEDL